ncbi:MAG: hypothetical protein P4L51_07735 [Puia sp.]|nr:hypothetical protein [Puia sp.]
MRISWRRDEAKTLEETVKAKNFARGILGFEEIEDEEGKQEQEQKQIAGTGGVRARVGVDTGGGRERTARTGERDKEQPAGRAGTVEYD